jgi:general stress protein 26
MADEAGPEKVWAMMKKIGFCMLASHDGEAIRARPMAAYVEEADGKVYFLTDAASAKDEEIEAQPEVCLAFADAGAQSYVSVSGHASVSNDRARIARIWSPAAEAWWESPEDPAIRLLTVTPRDAQYWDSPGTVLSYVKMAAAIVSDSRPAMGEHAKVEM